MRVYRLPTASIDRFESSGVEMAFLPRLAGADRSSANVARIAAGGTLGEHPATMLQVFAIVSGDAVVSGNVGESRETRFLSAGDAVVWNAGEVHQTWATTDVVAIILEASGAPELVLDDDWQDVTDERAVSPRSAPPGSGGRQDPRPTR